MNLVLKNSRAAAYLVVGNGVYHQVDHVSDRQTFPESIAALADKMFKHDS